MLDHALADTDPGLRLGQQLGHIYFIENASLCVYLCARECQNANTHTHTHTGERLNTSQITQYVEWCTGMIEVSGANPTN